MNVMQCKLVPAGNIEVSVHQLIRQYRQEVIVETADVMVENIVHRIVKPVAGVVTIFANHMKVRGVVRKIVEGQKLAGVVMAFVNIMRI